MVSTRTLRDPLHDLHPDLTPPQTHVLAALSVADEHGLPTSVLAQRICASGPTMTGVIDRLERQGLVLRARDDDDRRLVRVRLTDAGRVAVSVLDRHITDKLTHMLGALDVSDRDTFVRLLTRIIESIPSVDPRTDSRNDADGKASDVSTPATPVTRGPPKP